MSDRRAGATRAHTEGLKYARRGDANAADLLDFSPVSLGQRNPQHCPSPEGSVAESSATEALGRPLAIQEVAFILGCSIWTVRQRLLPLGLPHFRIGRSGKLMFFENQVVRWILQQQRKGGDIR